MADSKEQTRASGGGELAGKTARGIGWMMLLKLVMQSLGLISTLILVRLLSPQDFGLVAMAMVFIAIMDIFSSFSFDVVLIQKQTAERKHYDTAWSFTLIFHLISALILLAIAYPASLYYEEPRVTNLIVILAVGLVITGFENIGVVDFRKNMEFDKEFRFRLIKKVAAFSVTIPLAFYWQNYWALIVGMLTAKITGLVLSYVMSSYRPRFDLSARSELMHFSKWLFFSNIFYAFRMRGADLIIGKVSGARALGLFSISYELSNLPSTELVAPINRVVFSAYSKLAGDLEAMRRGYLSVIGLIALVIIPAGVGIAACARLLVPILLGDKWVDATQLISILSFYGVLAALQTNVASVYIALGKPKILTWLHLLHLVVLLAVAVPAILSYGVLGAAWSYLGVALVLLPINYAVMFKTISLAPTRFLSQLWRPVISAALMYFSVNTVSTRFFDTSGGEPGFIQLLAVIVLGAAVYTVLVVSLWLLSKKPPGAESYVLNVIKAKMGSKFKVKSSTD